MRCAKGRQEPVASRLWETPAVNLSLPFGCGVSCDGKIFRENRNMTQAELGKMLGGLPRQHVSNMENGLRPISKKIALRLSKAFDVSVERFIGQ